MAPETSYQSGENSHTLSKHYDDIERTKGREILHSARENIKKLDEILEEELTGKGRTDEDPESPIRHFKDLEEVSGPIYGNNWARIYYSIASRLLKHYKDLDIGEDVSQKEETGYAERVEMIRQAYYSTLKKWYDAFVTALENTPEPHKEGHLDFNSTTTTEPLDEDLRELGGEEYVRKDIEDLIYAREPGETEFIHSRRFTGEERDTGAEDLTLFRKAVYESLEKNRHLASSRIIFLKASELKVAGENQEFPDSQIDEIEARYELIDYFRQQYRREKKKRTVDSEDIEERHQEV